MTGVLTSSQNWELLALTFGTFAVTLAFVVLCGRRTVATNPSVQLSSRMGQGGWDFANSFATNVAVIGSVLSVILSSGALGSDTKILPVGAYAGLGIFFGVLVIVAPLLYNGTSVRVQVTDAQGTSYEYHGTVWGFLVAALVTAWGLLGSIATVFVILVELEYAGDMTVATSALLGVALFASVVFFGRYTWVRIEGTVLDQLDPTTVQTRASAMRQRLQLSPEAPMAPPASPRWAIL